MSTSSLATTALSAVGTGMSVGGQLAAGSNAAALGRAQAANLDVQAGQDVAQGSQEIANAALDTKYLISATRGAAGVNDVVSTSPSIVGLEGQIAARGSYSALSEMYAQREKASQLNYEGAMDIYSGNTKQDASMVTAFSTALSGIGTLATKYGGNGSTPGFNPLAAAQDPEFGGAAPAGGLT